MQNNSLQTHFWSDGLNPHQVFQDGRTIVHHRCLKCARDFAFELDGSGWHAAYVGIFKIEHLAESVNRQWMTQQCPGRPLWQQDQAARTMRIPELRPVG